MGRGGVGVVEVFGCGLGVGGYVFFFLFFFSCCIDCIDIIMEFWARHGTARHGIA